MAERGTPPASSPDALRRMKAALRRDTKPELVLRRELHRMGLRYRVDRSPLPEIRRRADVVFGRAHVAVFVDGCFWHGCPEHGTSPKANAEWWREKIDRNRARDLDTDRRLVEAGWRVVRLWEHEVERDPRRAAELVAAQVARSPSRPASS
jgi:DNA mismatch endonuclease (patch repair protein)